MAIISYGQENITISGLVKDSINNPIISANIWFISGKDSVHCISSENGYFTIKNIKRLEFNIRVEALGYQPWNKKYNYQIGADTIQLPLITLSPKLTQLQEFIVKGKQSPVLIKGDTLEYRISQYHLKEHSMVEDLLKRLPGLTVDANGNISFMGQPVTRIKINGQELFVSNIQILTRLLPTDLLDKVQLVQDYGEMASITGRKTGTSEQVLNLQTKSSLDKTHQIQASTGIGNKNRYNASLTGIFLSQLQQIFLVGNSNNTNTLDGNRKIENAMISWSKMKNNLTLRFNSSWEKSTSEISNQSSSKIISQDGILLVKETSNNKQTSNGFNIYTSGEFKSKKSDIIQFVLRGSIQDLKTNDIIKENQSGLQLLNQNTENSSSEKNKMLLGNVIYSKKLNKTGRIISTSVTINTVSPINKLDNNNLWELFNSDTSKVDSSYHQVINKNTNNANINFSVSFIEPLTSKSNLEIRYAGNKNYMQNSMETLRQLPNGKIEKIDTLSNNNKYNISKNEIGLNFKKTKNKFDFILGANINLYNLKSSSNNYNNNIISGRSLLPLARMQYQPNNKSSFVLSYNEGVDFPTYQQIQPVPDNTNYQFPIIGNPNLKPSKYQTIVIDYKTSGNNIFFLNLRSTLNHNKIVSNLISIKDTSNFLKQETHYLNANGDYAMNLNYGWDKQFKEGKIQMSFEGNNTYSNNVIYMENIKRYSKYLILNHKIKLSTYLDWIELSGNADYIFNHNIYILTEQNITNLQTWNFNVRGKLFFSKTWNLRINLNKQINEGLNQFENSNPTLINATLEKSFLKNSFVCKLEGFNLLNQNSNISLNVTNNTISQSKSNLIGSYFLFTIMLDLKKISTK